MQPRTSDMAGADFKVNIIPADRSNYSMPADGRYRLGETHGGFQALGICFHSAENNGGTAMWFKNPDANASTNFAVPQEGGYVDYMTSLNAICWAQGVPPERDRMKHSRDWMPNQSYNTFLVSIELEGYAKTLGQDFYKGSPQFKTLTKLVAFLHKKLSIPLDIDRWVMHSEISTWKSDPGPSFVRAKQALFDAVTEIVDGGAASTAGVAATPTEAAPPTPQQSPQDDRIDSNERILSDHELRLKAIEKHLRSFK